MLVPKWQQGVPHYPGHPDSNRHAPPLFRTRMAGMASGPDPGYPSNIPDILIQTTMPAPPLLNPDGRDENGWPGWVRAIPDILQTSRPSGFKSFLNKHLNSGLQMKEETRYEEPPFHL